MSLEFSFRVTGTDSVPTSYSTDVGGMLNAILDHYGSGSDEVLNTMDHAHLASFICHYIIYTNENNGTVNQPVNLSNWFAFDDPLYTTCVDGVPASAYYVNILTGAGLIQTADGGITYSLSNKVNWAPYDYKHPIDYGFDAGDLAACMNDMYSVGVDVSPYTCSTSPCTSACTVFDFAFPSTFCA